MNQTNIFTKLGIESLNEMQLTMQEIYPSNKNIVLLSPTGSGKTLAYLLPLFHSVNISSDKPQAIVLVPSRELAAQTYSVLQKLSGGVRSVALYGGSPTMEQHRQIMNQKPHIIIGTPGRILDHLNKENFDVADISTLVIDEFDKSLELGFQDEMLNIITKLKHVNRRILLSATDSPEIPDFVGKNMDIKYLDFTTDDATSDERISYKQVHSPVKDKLEILGDLLCTRGQETSLIFVGFRESVERVATFLKNKGFFASAFHGGMEQRDREKALFCFTSGSANIMVCTDLASRGLDISQLDNVIHYHLPLDEQSYIHRNGRTARWTAQGNSWIILGPEETLPEFISTCDIEDWEKPTHISAPSKPRWTSIYIGKGKKDKLSKGDIVGFFIKTGGLEKNDIGRIEVYDHRCYVSISSPRLKETLLRVKNQKIKGLKTIIEPTR